MSCCADYLTFYPVLCTAFWTKSKISTVLISHFTRARILSNLYGQNSDKLAITQESGAVRMDFQCITSSSLPQYAAVDAGTARCRMHPDAMRSQRIPIGAVLRVQVQVTCCTVPPVAHDEGTQGGRPGQLVEVLCIAWPDSFGVLQRDTVCLDICVTNHTSIDLPDPCAACKVRAYLIKVIPLFALTLSASLRYYPSRVRATARAFNST